MQSVMSVTQVLGYRGSPEINGKGESTLFRVLPAAVRKENYDCRKYFVKRQVYVSYERVFKYSVG